MARLRAVRQTKVVRLPIALPQLCDEPLNRLHAALPLRHPRTALTLSLTHAQTHTTHKIYKNTSNTFTFTHTHTHPTQVEDKMTQMAFSLCLSLSLRFSLSHCQVLLPWQQSRGWEEEEGGECEGEEKREARKSDGTSKWEIGESETTGRVKRGFALLLQCVCVVVCVRMCVRERECEREKESNYALVVRGRNRKNVFLVRDQEQECTLCSTQVCVVYIWPGLAACPLRCLCNFVSHS